MIVADPSCCGAAAPAVSVPMAFTRAAVCCSASCRACGNVKPDGVFDALARKEEQVQGLNQKLREKNAQLAKLYSEKLHAEAQENFIAAYLPVDFDACKTIAETLCADDNFSAMLFCNESDRLRYICARRKSTLCSAQKAVAAP